MNKLFDLTDKVVVITGASSGLGADAAVAFAESGAKVALLARRKEKLEEVKQNVLSSGGECIAVTCDVEDETSVKNAISEVLAHFGTIDVLINNAGIAVRGGVDTLTVENWDKALNTNLRGVFLVSKYVVPTMKAKKYGKIVNIASINAVIADKDHTFIRHSYNASKAGIHGLTVGMACSYAEYGITVNTVGPGFFESEMTAGTLFKSDTFLTNHNTQNPTSRPGRRGELNGTLLYLSSDASSYVQGQLILVDGGLTLI
ncbi:MAG: SDR family oxidoreductase [Prevotellaceae bacterium]|jgi:gluconate 5-dehydrogenase|nr:SDR family oxidoreductase [Prevotellaceae bacterium]